MHSTEYLLQEVQNKLQFVQNTIQHCHHEKQLLQGNIELVRSSVNQSLNRHIETLQCRAKWLNCHAESIYHLKDDALSQQIADLQNASNELNNCLSYSRCDDINDFRRKVKNSLKNFDDAPLLITENGSMTFNAEDEKLESMIISFGEIGIQSNLDEAPSNIEDFDTLSDDDDIFVLKRQKSIEMEIKSIEMIHMTSESANIEKQDADDIELQSIDDMESLTSYNLWLIKKTNPIESKLEKFPCDNADFKNKWLVTTMSQNNNKPSGNGIAEEKVSPWIVACGSNKQHHSPRLSSSITFDHLDLPTDQYLIKSRVTNDNGLPTSRVPPFRNPLMSNDEIQDVADSSDLFSRSKDNIENKVWTIKSTDSQSSNGSHLDSMIATDNSLYLRHVEIPQDRQDVKPPNKAVKHMDFILSQPNNVYLRNVSESTVTDPSLCEWLIGRSSIRCNDCDQSCTFDDSSNKDWLKIATNW